MFRIFAGSTREELDIDLRETQARGLMHRSSSVFIDYVQGLLDVDFTPGVQFWQRQGIDRFLEWRGRFYQARNQTAIDLDLELTTVEGAIEEEPRVPPRQEVVVSRIIRDSALSRFLKALYSYQCQICRFSFRLPSGSRYAETHHVIPLGSGHRGIDNQSNMLVVCPNHHAMMDYGVIAVHPDTMIVLSTEVRGPIYNFPLRLLRHPIDREFLQYHLDNIFNRVL